MRYDQNRLRKCRYFRVGSVRRYGNYVKNSLRTCLEPVRYYVVPVQDEFNPKN